MEGKQTCLRSLERCIITMTGWVLLAGLLVPNLAKAQEIVETSPKNGEIPITRKLDFSRVGFSVVTEPEFDKRLTDRAIARLKKRGLVPAGPDADITSSLIITLQVKSMDSICPGKVMYFNGLELWEEVIITRNPQLRTEAPVWTVGPGFPAIRDVLTIDQLEKDVDWYIDRFIVHYKAGNP